MTTESGPALGDNQTRCLRHPGLRDPSRLARHREAREHYLDEVLHPPDRSTLGYGLVVGVLVLILLGAFLVGPLPRSGERDCGVEPGPGVDWNGCSFEALVAPGANLAGANLRNVSLSGADLFGAKLKRADASFAVLPGAFLRGADMYQATLVGANLRQADLSFSSLREADLSYADLTGAQLTGADLAGARLAHTICRTYGANLLI